MKKSVLLLATAASLLAVSFSSQAASFNCKKASKATERAICANQRLNEADTKLTNTYNILWGFGADNESLRSEQLQWLRERNQCGNRVACISEEYQRRQRQLEQQIRYQQGG
ncbi:lysozyme inhibitor LprI family protein [Vitreoscilla massiliensis]|uniref:Lysozyme inhibitor LprI family protein n=1 Tax=Vitreoscilla massiliensis TaxID=1689272 RepID=A0ABY4E5X3_9NEIS|nr:lysozyme inhibitor LprI family protein [Vitreoscilla massiliensis]UOO91179.1 lysozyme inhibitor LprI family protein [Vitreoscilla massiliensis]